MSASAESRTSDSGPLDPHPWLSALPAVLTAAGVVLFGLLSVSYAVFYQRLGVNPEVVGLSYATTLTRSTGLLAVLAVAAVLAVRLYVRRRLAHEADRIFAAERAQDLVDAGDAADASSSATVMMALENARQTEERIAEARARAGDDPRLVALNEGMLRELEASLAVYRDIAGSSREAREGSRALVRSVLAVGDVSDLVDQDKRVRKGLLWVAVVGALLLVLTPSLVRPRADAVRRGESVEPLGVLGLTFLDVSARPARVASAGDVPKTPNVVRLGQRRLLYLGQSAGTLVLFDPVADRALHVPAASAVIRLQPPE